MSDQKPTGFVAVCKCGSTIGAIDITRMTRADVAETLGEWLFDGMTVEPRFGSWTQTLKPSCKCRKESI